MSSTTPRLSEERKTILAECIEAGWSITRIRKAYGIAPETIRKYHPDYVSPDHNKRISPEKLELIRKAIEDGWPLTQITTTHKVAYSTLRRHFPEFRGLDLQVAGSLGGFTRNMNKKMRRVS